MLQMLFRINDGNYYPCTPRGTDGKPREADGVEFFSIDQLAERTGKSGEFWRAEYRRFMADLLDGADRNILDGEATGSIAGDDGVGEDASPVASAGALSLKEEDVQRVVLFPHIQSDQEWAYVKASAKAMGVRLSRLVVERWYDEDSGQWRLNFIIRIGALRAGAQADKDWEYEKAPEFCSKEGEWKKGPWVGEKPPLAARVLIGKKGAKEPIEGIAYFARCAQFRRKGGRAVLDANGVPIPTAAWEPGKEAGQLGKCAAADGYRIGWAHKFGEAHLPEELPRRGDRGDGMPPEGGGSGAGASDEQAPRAGRPAMAMTSEIPDDPRYVVPLVDETIGDSVYWLKTQLFDLGLNSPAGLAAVELFKNRWPRIYTSYRQGWIAAVLHEVKKNPSMYGASAA